jgi:Predicted nucleotide-binding protein containing TIR-like domain
MNLLQSLKLHAGALRVAVDQDPKFFASVIHYVRRLDEALGQDASQLNSAELEVTGTALEDFWVRWRPSGDGLYIPPRQTADTDSAVREIHQLIKDIGRLGPDELTAQLSGILPLSPAVAAQPVVSGSVCVFLGHGRSKLWTRVKMFLEDDLGLATVAYESESRTGESIVPILEQMLEQGTFAVLVLSAEDETPGGNRRARAPATLPVVPEARTRATVRRPT